MTKLEKGLTAAEVAESRKKHGENKLEGEKRASFLKSFVSNFSDPIIRVLIIALFINIIFMFPNINWFESGGIAASILIATLVSTASEYSSSAAFERLKEQNENVTCRVRRNGVDIEISAQEIVVGDILLISSGERAIADMIIRTGELSVDESALTGESIEIKKLSHAPSITDSTVLKGSLILSGYAECEIIAVGANTYYGRVASELGQSTRPSPLKHRLTTLAKSVSVLGYIAAALIAFAYLFNVFFIDSHMVWGDTLSKMQDIKFVLSSCLKALTLAVSIIVVAVPEGLPMMITVVLSSNMKRMMSDGVIVRKLVGIETSGSLNILFTDKTGTLTEGKLRVKAIYTPSGDSFSSASDMSKNEKYKKYFTLCAGFCNNATYNGKRAIGSDATDRAIRELVKNDIPIALRQSIDPFDSAKKYMSANVLCGSERLTLFKGAPERLIAAATSYLSSDGEVTELKEKDGIYKKLKELTSSAYRVVALGMKAENNDTSLDQITLIALVAIRDKIRREVPSAIKEVTGAGVGVVMITGDNKETAEAIAKECGIISSFSRRKTIITGEEMSKMTDDEIAAQMSSIAVIARALPSDKSRLVRIAQSMGLVVGMTGDGINDASSLKAADVGYAMGSGTEVAKEASDIVISDNSFTSIVKAILYGRTIFESIRKFIVFQLTMNLGAVGISLIGPFIGVENPVTVSQMLWVNIIMDTLGALAFASEPSEKAFMKMKPKFRDEKIISHSMLGKIVLNGIYILALCIFFLKSDAVSMLLTRADEKYILSAFFCMFIFTGIFVCFTSRTSRLNLFAHLSENRSFILIMLLISVAQMTFIYFGGDIFRTVPLKIHDLVCVICISFSVVIFDFIRKTTIKCLKLKKSHRKSYKRKIVNKVK